MAEVENIVLEPLRLMRSEIAAQQKETQATLREVRDDIRTLSQRIDAIETEVRSMNYIMTMVIGSAVHDIRDLQGHVGRLETTEVPKS